MIMDRSFTLTIVDSKQSRLRRLRNGLPQGSVLAPLFFNIYTYDLPSVTFKKYAYADDLTLLYASRDWKTVKDTLSQDITTVSVYLQTWRLKLSSTKTVTAAFHLDNREGKRELNLYNNGNLLPLFPVPTYLEVKLDRSLTFRHHLKTLRKKLSTRVVMLRRLAGSGWGAGANTLRISALFLIYSTAEYCAPVWCRSTHTRPIDSILNDALCIVTGCLRPTPRKDLHVLAGIQQAELRHLGATLSLANRAIHDPDHVLHGQLVGQQNAHQGRLRSRRPFVPAARKLLDSLSELDIPMKQWTKHKWNADYLESTLKIRAFIPRISSRPLKKSLPRTSWVRLNRLRTGVRRFHYSMYKWGLAPSPNCTRGTTEQTADHVISSCLLHHVPRATQGLQVLDDAIRCWLNTTTASIQSG